MNEDEDATLQTSSVTIRRLASGRPVWIVTVHADGHDHREELRLARDQAIDEYEAIAAVLDTPTETAIEDET